MAYRISILAIMFLVGPGSQARAVTEPGYSEYLSWADWAQVQPRVRAGLASSYDRSGGNSDYSHYEWPEGLVLEEIVATVKTIKGPGMIYRFWMPHLTAKRCFVVRMFFDDEPTPRIDTTSDVLLAGGFSYFSAPLVNTCAGGQVCYEPIPFAHSLRIETVNKTIPPEGWSPDLHYYQYTYLTFPAQTVIDSYTGTLTPQEQAARTAVVDMFNSPGDHPAGASPTAIRLTTPASAIPAGGCLDLAGLIGPGLIRQLNVQMAAATDEELAGLRLEITYDDEPAPAIDVSIADFFGAGNPRTAYQSLVLGTDSPDGFYCYWPMPFRQTVTVRLCNAAVDPISIDSAVVEYEPQEIDINMGYLRAHAFTDVKQPEQIYHPILSASGRGHYVGNLLYIEQSSYDFHMLEGDEIITIDGTDVLSGTGLEDAYNGGYYYNWVGVQEDEPEGPYPQSATRPLSGVLYVHRESGYARADQYRWYVADRIPFAESIEVKIENRYAVDGATWTSVALWYQQPPVPGDADDDGDVDLADFAAFQACFAQIAPQCLSTFDLDESGTVDLLDYAALHATLMGPW